MPHYCLECTEEEGHGPVTLRMHMHSATNHPNTSYSTKITRG